MKNTSLSIAAALTLAVGVTLVAAPASAHSFLLASSPEDGAIVTALPEQFSVTANEPLLDLSGTASGFAIQVVDEAGRFYGDGCLVVSESTLAMGATLGEAGPYRLYWQVVSADAHTVSGELAFAWSPAEGAEITAGLAAPPVCGETGETTPTPSVTPTESATPQPEPTTTPAPAPDEAAAIDPLLLGGGVLAVLALAAAILLGVRALRRRDT